MTYTQIEPLEKVANDAKEAQTGKTYKMAKEVIQANNPDAEVIDMREKEVDYNPLAKAIATAKGEYVAPKRNRAERRKYKNMLESYHRKLDKKEAQARLRAEVRAKAYENK